MRPNCATFINCSIISLGVRIVQVTKLENFVDILENEIDYLEHCVDNPFGELTCT